MKYTLVFVLLLLTTPAWADFIDLGEMTSGTASIHTCFADLCGPVPASGSFSVSGPTGFGVGGLFYLPISSSPIARTLTAADLGGLILIQGGVTAADGSHGFLGGFLSLNGGRGQVNGQFDTYTFTTGPWDGSIVESLIVGFPFCQFCTTIRVDGELRMVPEPATWLLMATGLGLLIWRRTWHPPGRRRFLMSPAPFISWLK